MNKSSIRAIWIVLKIIIIVAACVGITMSALAARGEFMGGSRVFMYFTTQSNIMVAVIAAIELYRTISNNPGERVSGIIKFVGAIAITLTGIVFCFVLAPSLGPKAWNFQNTLTHVVVPITTVVDFFVPEGKYEYKYIDDLWVIVPPILYAIYSGIGYSLNWQFGENRNYPYFFLNWGSPAGTFGFCKGEPYMGVAWWILAIFFFLLLVGLAYLKIHKIISKRAVK